MAFNSYLQEINHCTNAFLKMLFIEFRQINEIFFVTKIDENSTRDQIKIRAVDQNFKPEPGM